LHAFYLFEKIILTFKLFTFQNKKCFLQRN
jgi:hypothetical protein